MYIGIEIRERRKRLGFCASKTPPTRIRIETSRKRERMVEAKASIIELASVNREMISPVRRVAKKDQKYGGYRIKSHQCLISDSE